MCVQEQILPSVLPSCSRSLSKIYKSNHHQAARQRCSMTQSNIPFFLFPLSLSLDSIKKRISKKRRKEGELADRTFDSRSSPAACHNLEQLPELPVVALNRILVPFFKTLHACSFSFSLSLPLYLLRSYLDYIASSLLLLLLFYSHAICCSNTH